MTRRICHSVLPVSVSLCCLAASVLAWSGTQAADQRAALTVTDPRCEYAVNPLGIDVARPRFSWILESAARGQRQAAYQVLVAGSEAALERNEGDKWDSGKVDSGRSFHVVYEGKPLASREVCWWKVRSWNQDGTPSAWSRPATFEMGLLAPADWKGQWIGRGGAEPVSSPLLRKEIEITGKVKHARAYVSGIGWSELSINGKKVSDDVLSPGLTDYSQEILYCTYDVTSMLQRGRNVIGLMLGNGWFSSPNILPPWARAKPWADRPQAILQLTVTDEDGTETHFSTDETWKTASGPIVANHKNPGEECDARLERPGWNMVGHDDRQWERAAVLPSPGGRLTCQTIPPMKVQATLVPIKRTRVGPGVWEFEFDRFFAGWVRLKVKGKAGAKITIDYGKGERDSYILKGAPAGEVYEPRFTFHPVRHVRLEGIDGEPAPDAVVGREIYSDVDLYGDFSCSNGLFNEIHANIQRSLKVGLKGFILDGIHREPIAYNEPASIFGSLATRKHMPDLWASFAHSIRLAGSANGDLSDVVPRLPGMNRDSDVSQNGSYPMLVWYLYQCYGDERLLADHYPKTRAWVDFIGKQLADGTHIVRKGWLGEHMLPGRKPGEEHFISPETPKDFIWTCLYYQNARVLSDMGRALGKREDAERYARLAEEIKDVVNKTWLDPKTGHYATGSQTADILPLALGIVPPENRQKLIDQIARTITATDGGKLRVGHAGLPGFMESLADHGLGEIVYRTVNQTDYPGWGYMVSQRATTVWECWGGANANNREESMTMLTGVGRFFYDSLAGIQEPAFYGTRPFEPGYERICIRPHVLGDLRYAGASIKTVRGVVSSWWERIENLLVLDVVIPANTVATVSVPVLGMKNPVITESGKMVWRDGSYVAGVEGIISGKQDSGHVTFDVGSGRYRFKVTTKEGIPVQ